MLWGGGQFPTGYGSFMLPTPKGWRARYAHRLAWEMARGPIPPGMFVCHKCDVRACVNVDHLFLGTNADNVRDAVSKRRHAYGERAARAKLTEQQVVEIRSADGTQAEMAARFGVSRAAISDIRRGKRWKLTGGELRTGVPGRPAKLNISVARMIRAASGTQAAIATGFGVSQTTVSQIRAGLIWKE
jgi:predicted XRE-type DNA-binding protein